MGMSIFCACRGSGSLSAKSVVPPAYMERQPSAARPDSFSFPSAVPLELGHGMKGLLVERTDLPLVNLRIIIGSGIADDPLGRVGVAYATCQMLDEGAGKYTALELSSALLQIGATLSSHVDGDTTIVAMQVLRRYLDEGLDLLAEMILRPHFSEKEWTRVRGDLISRALQRRDQPSHVAQLALKATVYGDHPYSRPALPLLSQLEKIQVEQLKEFHQAHYRPENLAFVAAGAVTARELAQRLSARFKPQRDGSSARARKKKDADPAENDTRPPRSAPRLALVERKNAAQSVLRVGHLGPSRSAANYAGIRVLNTLFGGSFTSRLNQNLREKHGYTYGARSSFSLPQEAGLFSIRTSVDTPNTAAALQEIFREMKKILERPVSRQELSKAQQLVVEELPGMAETLDGLVEAYSELVSNGLALDTYQRLPAEIAALTPERVQALARRLLRPERAAIVVVGDAARLAEPLQKIYGKARFLDADGQRVLNPQQNQSTP
jgi:zinc protease